MSVHEGALLLKKTQESWSQPTSSKSVQNLRRRQELAVGPCACLHRPDWSTHYENISKHLATRRSILKKRAPSQGS